MVVLDQANGLVHLRREGDHVRGGGQFDGELVPNCEADGFGLSGSVREESGESVEGLERRSQAGRVFVTSPGSGIVELHAVEIFGVAGVLFLPPLFTERSNRRELLL